MRGIHLFSQVGRNRTRFIPAHAGNTQPVGILHDRFHRFIPAHAGNTEFPMQRNFAAAVHPRACGEYASLVMAARQRVRFIPAHAGNTLPPRKRDRYASVHPRACGEYAECYGVTIGVAGSSPRMRGIPSSRGNRKRLGAVHPRACGEYTSQPHTAKAGDGSSPRMRGILVRVVPGHGRLRFIPAHAGNTRARSSPAAAPAVHPRACGEYHR